MKVSRQQVAENRCRILEAAGKLFRARGFESVTVAEVMKAAGLTHGGFYGYFTSKDDLIAQCLVHASGAVPPKEVDLVQYAASYLSVDHCGDLAGGCLMAALGPETSRQGPEARAAMTAGLQRQIERLSKTAPGATAAKKRQAAIGNWSAMVGALILARISDDPKLAEEVLAQTKAWIASRGAKPH